jgi:hypothetical protein
MPAAPAKRKRFFLALAAAVALLLLGVAIFSLSFSPRAVKRWRSLFVYSLDAYRKTDPALVLHEESKPLPAVPDGAAALAVDGRGRIFVGGRSEILVFEPDGTRAARWPVEGPAACLAVGPSDRVFLGLRDRIDVLGPDGAREASWTPLGEKAMLTSLAAGATDLYAADAGQRLVWRFDHTGRLLGTIRGRKRPGSTHSFIVPTPFFEVAVGPDGALWVANTGARELEKYAPEGTFASSWGTTGLEVEAFCGC